MQIKKNLGLVRRASGLMALEQRFMFDGAAVADALQVALLHPLSVVLFVVLSVMLSFGSLSVFVFPSCLPPRLCSSLIESPLFSPFSSTALYPTARYACPCPCLPWSVPGLSWRYKEKGSGSHWFYF